MHADEQELRHLCSVALSRVALPTSDRPSQSMASHWRQSFALQVLSDAALELTLDKSVSALAPHSN